VKYLLSTVVVLALVLGISYGAHAQTEITLLAPGPIRGPLNKLIPGFENKTGDTVKVTYGGGSRETPPYGTRQLVARGQGLDVSIIFAPYPEAVASGSVVPSSATTIARMLMTITVKKGAPMPDVSNAAAVKRTLLAAKSIVIVEPSAGTLGSEAMAVLNKLDIAGQVKPKLKIVDDSRDADRMVGRGEAELFLGPQFSDAMPADANAVMLGALPHAAFTPIDVVGYISTHAKDPKACKALLQYLRSPEAEAAFKAARMEPAH
jgi:molybdate transport system substrate-binding protein